MQPHRGTLILVLGILSIVICQPLGFFAWIMGNSDLKAMAEGRMDPAGRDLTVGGKICGIIGVILFVLTFLFVVFMMLLGGGLAIFGAREATQQTPPESLGVPEQVIELLIAR
jgi:hypothetical protein